MYPEVVSFVLKRYTSDEVMADSDAEVTSYKQNTGTTDRDFLETLDKKT